MHKHFLIPARREKESKKEREKKPPPFPAGATKGQGMQDTIKKEKEKRVAGRREKVSQLGHVNFVLTSIVNLHVPHLFGNYIMFLIVYFVLSAKATEFRSEKRRGENEKDRRRRSRLYHPTFSRILRVRPHRGVLSR
jgi:hypothetical protein